MIDDATNGAGIDTVAVVPQRRPRLPAVSGRRPRRTFRLSSQTIDIRVTLDEQESATYIANSNAGKLTGLFLLGWGADYPDVTNFLDYHFGAGCTSSLRRLLPGHRRAL